MKLREFWIEFGGDPSDDKEVYKRYSAAVPFKPCGFSDEVIHCREVKPEVDAAIEKLVSVCEKTLIEMPQTFINHQTYFDLKEALEACRSHAGSGSG